MKKLCCFCEYHDDMAEYDKSKNFKFFQIKTKEKNRHCVRDITKKL